MRSSRLNVAGLLLAAIWLWGAAGPAQAADGKVEIHLTVSHASAKPGPIEAPGIYKQFKRDFNFQSHRVLQERRLNLRLDQEGTHKLPTGRKVRLRPTELRKGDLMMHVEVEGAMKSDLRMRSGKQVTIRVPQSYEGGNLLVTLKPSF